MEGGFKVHGAGGQGRGSRGSAGNRLAAARRFRDRDGGQGGSPRRKGSPRRRRRESPRRRGSATAGGAGQGWRRREGSGVVTGGGVGVLGGARGRQRGGIKAPAQAESGSPRRTGTRRRAPRPQPWNPGTGPGERTAAGSQAPRGPGSAARAASGRRRRGGGRAGRASPRTRVRPGAEPAAPPFFRASPGPRSLPGFGRHLGGPAHFRSCRGAGRGRQALRAPEALRPSREAGWGSGAPGSNPARRASVATWHVPLNLGSLSLSSAP